MGRLEDNVDILEAFDDVDISFTGVNNAIIVALWLGQIVTETENTVKIKSNCSAYTNGSDGAKFICKFDIYITICCNENDKKVIDEYSMQDKINLEEIRLKEFEFVLIDVDYDSVIFQ